MKKLMSIFAIIGFIAVSMSSCKKCGTCSVLGVSSQEVCGTSSEISTTKSNCELAGGTWEAK